MKKVDLFTKNIRKMLLKVSEPFREETVVDKVPVGVPIDKFVIQEAFEGTADAAGRA
jgi:hypothetical protein